MSNFRDAADVGKYLGSIFEIALETPGIGERLVETGKTLRLKIVDPEATLFLDFPGRRVIVGDADADAEPDVTLQMSGDLANRFWQGQANLMTALAGRKIKVTGNIASLMKIQPHMDALYAVYVGLLKQDHRSDLLIS